MPKKPNFLGGNQNYDEKNGQYLPNLVGANGQVVKDADGDGKTHESWEKDFSPEEVKKMKNEYSGKEEHIKKLKDAGFRVDEGYKAGNTFKIDGKDFGDEASISIGEDGKYFRVTKNGGSYTYRDLDTAIDRAKYISGKSPSEDAIGWETGSYDAKTEQEFLMGKSKEQEQDFNDPKERESLKEEEKEFNDEVSDEDIEVELADHEWAVTDKTTVGQYAEMVGGILGVPKERVLEKIKARSSNELDESSLMYKVIDEDTGFDGETETKDSLKPITYDEFFESSSNKQIVDDYVSDYFDRAKRQGEQANISADQIVEEFKKDWNGFYSEETLPLIKERIQDKIGYPKGTSKEYTQKINKQFDESYKTLKEKYGFTDEQLKSDKVSETLSGVHQLFDNSQFYGGKSKWSKEELLEIANALDVLDDKYYNDYYIRLAPRGY